MSRTSLAQRIVLVVNAVVIAALAILVGVLSFEKKAPPSSFTLAKGGSAHRAAWHTEAGPPQEPIRIDAKLFEPAAYALEKIEDATQRALVADGQRLINQTYALIGPHVENEDMRFAGNELACRNCHLDAGLKPFAGSYVGVAKRYPNFRARENKIGTIEDRINGCMERSMNGRALPSDSEPMRAMVAYMTWLSHLAPSNGKVAGMGFIRAQYPARPADPARGAEVYRSSCAACHGNDARGQKQDSGVGYVYPPLAGPDTYNHGAGMHRVLTAMSFIQANMPLGATADSPRLSDDDAFDVAAYINGLKRPQKTNTQNDFPDRSLKPMSTPYPPFADPFSTEQHKLGPFPPIFDFYRARYALEKTK